MSSPHLGHRPAYLGKDKPTRIQRKGLLYEKKVARALVEWAGPHDFILWGQWIYWDRAVCQPDLLLIPPKGPIVVVEVKLTRKRNVEKKLREVYGSAVDRIFAGRGVAFAQIYKNQDGGTAHGFDLDLLRNPAPYSYTEILWR